jgi:hypothetical protein
MGDRVQTDGRHIATQPGGLEWDRPAAGEHIKDARRQPVVGRKHLTARILERGIGTPAAEAAEKIRGSVDDRR